MNIHLLHSQLGAQHVEAISYDGIRQSIKRLSLESAFLSDAVGFVRDLIPRTAVTLRDTTSSLFRSSDEKQDFLDKNKFQANIGDSLMKLPAYGFSSIASLVVPVPESFAGNMLKYSDLMTKGESSNANIYSVTVGLLEEYNTTLAQFLSASETRTNLSPSMALYTRVKKEREDFTDMHKKFFPLNTGKSHARLGDIFDRAQDVIDLKPRVPVLREAYINAPIMEIKQLSDRCVAMLDAISKLSESNDIRKVTPQVAHKLATGAYEVGKLLELISVHRVRQETLLKSIFDLFALLKDRL